jgi:hypothetical protein
MPLRLARTLPAVVCAIAVTATIAHAQDAGPAALPHVRAATADAAELLDELIARSPTARDLIDQLDHSDLVVYVRYQLFATTTLRGRIGFLESSRPRRLAVIEIAYRNTWTDQLVALGHELQHAVEIAGAPLVWDAPSLAAFYGAVGESTGHAGRSETFETAAAAATGRRVRNELATIAAPAVIAGDDRN